MPGSGKFAELFGVKPRASQENEKFFERICFEIAPSGISMFLWSVPIYAIGYKNRSRSSDAAPGGTPYEPFEPTKTA
jgi:hypothetical protein